VADAFDTMTNPRDGGFGLATGEALRLLLSRSQRQFDGEVVNKLCDLKARDQAVGQHEFEIVLVPG